jgi:hypothetical protein
MIGKRSWLGVLAGVVAVAAIGGGYLAAAPAIKTWPMKQDGDFTAVETPHYRVRSDMGVDITQIIATHQEALYLSLLQRMGSFKPAVVVTIPHLDVLAVKTKEKYEEVAGKDAKGSQGIFSPSASQITTWNSPDNLDTIVQTLRHEGTHQFTMLYLGPKCPIWLNEGLAEFFKYGQYRDGQLVTGQVPISTLMSLRKTIADGKFVPVADLVSMPAEEWSNAVKAKGAGASGQYNEAWAMVHCLEAADNGKYRDAFIKYMSMVARGNQLQQAWNVSFGAPPAAFEKRFLEYIAALKPTEGIGCRGNLNLLGALVLKSHGSITNMKALREFALAGNLGDWNMTYGDGLKVEFKDTDLIKMVFRCPEDTSKGDTPSYELVPGKDGEPMIVRCRHHPGFTLETAWSKNDRDGWNLDVVARPALTGTAAKTAPATKEPAATTTGATKS